MRGQQTIGTINARLRAYHQEYWTQKLSELIALAIQRKHENLHS